LQSLVRYYLEDLRPLKGKQLLWEVGDCKWNRLLSRHDTRHVAVKTQKHLVT